MVDTRFTVSIHIMAALAYAKEGSATSPRLAEGIRTSPVVIRRLVSKLVDAGLVLSTRGKSGGIKLARPADQISLSDIFKASTEKPLIAVATKPALKNCPVSCSMQSILCDVRSGLEKASLEYLSKIRLSDLVSKIPPPSAK